ncbi:AzlD domain-containing protein [Saezia sanguinis]|uniref:AzlD domain-containing protein n=1 Tax=Saezia sanguinis TaxID=1965230 RepID=UPI00302F3D7F
MMSETQMILVIIGLTVVTVVTRSFFFISSHPWQMPEWVTRGLRYAPLAALTASIGPAILLSPDGHGLIHTLQDARIYAVLAALAWYLWRRGMLGTIIAGMAVYLPLHVGLGW